VPVIGCCQSFALNSALIYPALRRNERVPFCLSTLAHLVFEKPELFSGEQIELLVSSLEPWNKSTALNIFGDSSDGFPEAKRPQLRSLLAGLVGAIKRWYVKMEPLSQIPSEVSSWESACAKDALPEVRRAFNQSDQLFK
jgi:hypothetical protein